MMALLKEIHAHILGGDSKKCFEWPVSNLIFDVIVEKYDLEKKGVPNIVRKKNSCLQKGWTSILKVCNEEEKNHIKGRVAVPATTDAGYKT